MLFGGTQVGTGELFVKKKIVVDDKDKPGTWKPCETAVANLCASFTAF